MTSPVVLARAVPGDRLRDAAILGGLVAWLAYTRIYWSLQAAHVVMPPCPFFYLTGHPCPFCGGTRSFAYMWQGDLANAVRLYPLGPALFAGTFVAVVGLVGGIVTGRTWVAQITGLQWRLIAVAAVTTVALSWGLKVFVLGN